MYQEGLCVLQKLVDVNVNEAWTNEASEFTPWLSENLDRLSEALNMPLEFVNREVFVGKFKADILAMNPEDGHNVLIENQLRPSDHEHIGQILTYLAGVDAKTIIWIAPSFRDEHQSAIRWLNQNTHDDIAFFAVQLRVVQIADSPLAPLFEVVEKPNNWDRNVHKTIADKTPSELGWRQKFWERYVIKFPHAANDRGGGRAGSSRWRVVPESDLIVARWVTASEVGIFIRGERGVQTPSVYEELSKDVDFLHQKIGVPIGRNPKSPFNDRIKLEISDEIGSDQAIEWLESKTKIYVDALIEYEDQLK
jgi:hypothetical protein